MKIASLPVQWSHHEPPLAAKIWVRIESGAEAEGDSAIERELGWPKGTLSYLRAGFDQRLNRTSGWEIAAEPGKTAAKYFKRGVAARLVGQIEAARSIRQGAYAITVESRLDNILSLIESSFLIVDSRVAAAWPELKVSEAALVLALDEHVKTLETVALVVTRAKQVAQGKPWLAIGGGILADIAAFAAYLENADIDLVPTTLLAMADACIGGKTGVNFPPYGKNLVGAFKFPRSVTIWADWLQTLPQRELLAGGAECLKHAFLHGNADLAEKLAIALATSDLASLGALLPEVMRVKSEVVARDPSEAGERATLNLGHTLGHALEAVSQSRTKGESTLLHGEAVGIGLAFAIHLSENVAGLKAEAAKAMLRNLRSAGCMVEARSLALRLGFASLSDPALFPALKRAIGNDKKNQATGGETTEWVLLSAASTVARGPEGAWTVPVKTSDVEATWQTFIRTL